MPYAVYKQKGGLPGLDKYIVKGIPTLIHSVAVYITPEQEIIAKHLMGVFTFKDIEKKEPIEEEVQVEKLTNVERKKVEI